METENPKPSAGSSQDKEKPSTVTDGTQKRDEMRPYSYVLLLFWLTLSNILAFLMLMVVAPKAEDFVTQSLEQKRREHGNNRAVAETGMPGSGTIDPQPDTVASGQQATQHSMALANAPDQRNSAVVNSLLEPFVGIMKPLQSVLLLAFISGYLGGSLHGLASLVHHRASDKLTRHWTLWYIARPLKGAITAVIFSFIIQAGLMTGVSGDSVVNPIGVIALSLLVGMSAHDAVSRLGIVFATFFNTHRHDLDIPHGAKVLYDESGNPIVVHPDGTCRSAQVQKPENVTKS